MHRSRALGAHHGRGRLGGDAVLSIILSKAQLLMDDDKITDRISFLSS